MTEEILYVFAAESRDALAEAEPFRGDGAHRLAILARDAADLAAKRERAAALLRETTKPHFNSGNVIFYAHVVTPPKVAFLFPGYGAKHAGLVAELHARFDAVRRWMASLSPRQQHCFRNNEFLFPATAQSEHRLWVTLEAIVGSNLAMHALLAGLGVRCDAMAGHSYGENAMLVASGAASSEEVIALLRGLAQTMERAITPPVAMLAVPTASLPPIAPPLHLALDNCPQQAVVCGPPEDIAKLEAGLRANGQVVFRVAGLDQPVHTPLLPVSDETLRELCAPIGLHAPQTRIYSCATVAPFPEDRDEVRALIASQWKSTVRFRETIERMYDHGIRLFVEVGAGDRLTGFVRDTLRGKDIVALSSHHESRPVVAQLQLLMAQLYVRGAVDARALEQCFPRRDVIRETLANVLGVTADGIDPDTGFFDLSLTSVGALALVAQLEQALGRKLPQTLAFDFPTLNTLSAYLHDAPRAVETQATIATHEPIAIVGIGCRFPGGADSPDAFWQLLDEQRDAIVDVPPDRWNTDDFDEMPRLGGFLREDVSRFDATFFGISPREAMTLDPQQRLLLEVTWEALEHAAIDPTSLAGTRTAVFTGISSNDYASRFTPQQRMQIRGYLGTGNTLSTAAGRVSYVLGLLGPSMSIDTACSSSLVAVHLACRSLRSGESDVALAGGVNLLLSPENTFLLHRAQALSPDSRCATFDENANGYVRGEGCGVVVLKRLRDAIDAGDDVLAVIRGSAVTHDGRTSGLLVPSGRSQQLVVREALRDAALAPRDVSYVEAHGTGTSLGDPIEVHALGEVFSPRATPLVLGALKTNIGHLESAAGIAGVIKVVLQLQHRRIAASLHCTTPSTKIDWHRLPVAVATTPRPWDAQRRIAGVSSFGISGTNAHVILEEAPHAAAIDDAMDGVITLSAKSPAALRELEARFATIEKNASVACTTNIGRAHFKHRKAIALSPEWEPIAKRYEAGETIDWRALHAHRKRRRVALPTYPFERERYWIDSDAFAVAPQQPARNKRIAESTSPLDRLHAAAARILELPKGAALDREQPFQQLGFDSLMAMELSNFVQTEYGVAIPAARIIGEHSLSTLAASLPRRTENDDAVIVTNKTEGPLSYGQRALWFLHALVPDSSAYNQSLPLRVQGDVESIRERCEQLVQRHAAMRTIFPRISDEPVQRVLDRVDVDFAIGDDDAQRRPFDLERGPLVRFRLHGDMLTIVMHHIICDGWSFELIRRELLDDGLSVRPVEHTYLDYVQWEQRRLASDEGQRLREYWHRQLAAPRPLLALPTDRPRPTVQTMHGDSIAFTIDSDLATKMRELARSNGTTPFAAFFAAFLVLLRRYSQQDELLVGTPTAGRPRAELAHIVGYFVDVVVLRTRTHEGQSFRELLQHAGTTTQAALEHTGYPFALLVEELRVERDPGRSPLFDVLFNYLRHETVADDVPQADGKFDLTLTILDAPHGTRASLGYNTDLYDRATIARFRDDYLAIVRDAVAHPSIEIDALPIADITPVLTGRPSEHVQPIHRMFEAQAAREPDAGAIVANGASLTYRELNERADALARELTPGIIPLCEPRTPELLVRLLAILKAGGAYLPLDPVHPEALRRTMIEEASRAPHDGLAYVIFTSGSTGKPKGVAVEHRAIANYVASIVHDVAFPPRASCAFISTIAADLGQTVLFPTLATGGTVHLIDEAIATDGAAFARYVREHAIDVLKIVPSHLAALLDTGGAEVLPRKTLILGGEGVAPRFIAQLHALAPQLRIFNHYGPTETTVGVLTREITPGEPLTTRTLPLRNAVAGAEIYLLERGRSVAHGAIGEVAVGGTPLARGYVNAQNEPFTTLANGARVYRTGDLARLTSRGDLELLGRRDRQLNIHGQRIEPAQVEAALRECGVTQCAVLPNADGDAATQLIAYVAGERRELSHELAQRLPRHMLPSSFVFVDRLPLTSNGKLDTHALRALHAAQQARLPIRARDPFELQLARLWSDVLGVAHVGMRDDFFALGGHSLLAVRLASRIEDELHVRVPLATFFTHRTVEQLAIAIRERTPPSLLVPLQSRGAQPPLFCFPGAGGSVMYFSDLARHLGGERPIFGLQPPDDASIARVEQLAALALPEIRKRANGEFLFAGHSFGALVAYECARRLLAENGVVAQVAVLDNAAPGAMHEHEYERWSEGEWLRHVGQRMEKLYGANLQLDEDLTVDALIARMLDASLLPSGTNAANFRRFIAVYRANAMAAATYRPVPVALPIPITVFRATEHDAELGNAATAGWSRYSSDVRVIDAVGTHITMMTEPHVGKLASDLREVLHQRRTTIARDIASLATDTAAR